ncbi:MAG: cardiolipin synthase [Bacilli bacterium]|nr:cardiolipin synthase [Bacilli bacterium]
MKLLRLIFSKYFISILIILIQITAINIGLNYLKGKFLIADAIISLVAFVIYFIIINRNQNPEYKIAWLALVATFPIVGITFFIMFGNPRLKKKQSAMMEKTHEKTQFLVDLTREEKKKLYDYLGEYVGIEKYLRRNGHTVGSMNSRVTYYDIGEKMWEAMKDELRKAKKFIFMEYFIVDPGVMWNEIHEILKEKAKEGVEVRFLYDDLGSMTMLKSGYYKTLREEGINCYKFNKIRAIVSGSYNNRDHRKITVIDGKVGFTGGINLGDEYINVNKRLGHWKDVGIKIEGEAVRDLTELFLFNFDMTSKNVSNYDKYFDCDYESFENCGYVHPFGTGPNPFYPEQIGENLFIYLINHAKRYIYFTTPYLIIDYNLTNALRTAALRGVDVRIVVPHIPDKKLVFNMTKSSYGSLLKAGVKIYQYEPGFIHAKSIISDNKIGFVGTINMDYRSLTHHYECGAVIYDAPCLVDLKEDFLHTFDVSIEITKENYKIKRFPKFIITIIKAFFPMF